METWARPAGNLGREATSVRLRTGVIALATALVIAVVLVKLEIPPAYRALLFVPFLVAANGFYQGLYRTWVFAASRGLRELDSGIERVADPTERARFKRIGWQVVTSAMVTAVIATTMFVFIA